MATPTFKIEEDRWDGGDGIVVRYSLEVMEELRRLSVDGLNSFAHGGLEIGGVLYGRRDADSIQILAFAELACEHAVSPRFVLSEKDRKALEELFEERPEDYEALGWFRAHTRSGPELDQHDREMFDRYFPDDRGVALILMPTSRGPVDAAFFVREPSGEVRPSSPRVFTVEPGRVAPAKPVVSHAEPAPQTVAYVEPPPVPLSDEYLSHFVPSAGEAKVAAPWWKHHAWVWVGCGIFVLTAAVLAFRPQGGPAHRLNLQAVAIAPGQVRIDWNGASPAVLQGASGLLEIADGNEITRIPMSPERLRSNTVIYGNHTSHVTVYFGVESTSPGIARAEDQVEMVGMPLPPVDSPPPPVTFPPPSLVASGAAPSSTGSADRMMPEPGGNGSRPVANGSEAHRRSTDAADPGFYSGPRSGRLIWHGLLNKRGTLEINSSRASAGALSGGLPGVPLTFKISPAEFGRNGLIVYTADRSKAGMSERPAKSNGWNATHYKLDEGRSKAIAVVEGPARGNHFSRLVLRNDGRSVPVMVIDWQVQ